MATLGELWEEDRLEFFKYIGLLLIIPAFLLFSFLSKDDPADYPCQDETLRCRVQRADSAGCDVPQARVDVHNELINEYEVESALTRCGY